MATKARAKARRQATSRKAKQYTRAEIEQYDKELRKHFGRWVCIVGYHIVSVADGPGEALEKARKLGYKDVRVKRAPLSPNAGILIA